MYFMGWKAEVAGKLKYASKIPIFEIDDLPCIQPAVEGNRLTVAYYG
jgi:hypothetical protein